MLCYAVSYYLKSVEKRPGAIYIVYLLFASKSLRKLVLSIEPFRACDTFMWDVK